MTSNTESKEEGKLRKLLSNFEEYVAGTLLLVMVVIAFVNVVTRYFLKYSLAFTEEIGVNMFVWMTILGIAIAFKRGSHLSVVFLRDRAPPLIRKTLTLTGLVLSLGLFLVIIYLSLKHTYTEMVVFQTRSEALNIPAWIYVAGVPVFSTVVVIRIIQAILREVRKTG